MATERRPLGTIQLNRADSNSNTATKKVKEQGRKHDELAKQMQKLDICEDIPQPWIQKRSKSRNMDYFFHPSLNISVWENERADLQSPKYHGAMHAAVSNIPLPKHTDFKKGEDRWLLSEHLSVALVVDGVGGSTNRAAGVDAGKYASALCACCESELNDDSKKKEQRSLAAVMHTSANQLHPGIKGTAVFVAARLDTVQWLLEVVHMGDAQLLLIRGNKIIYHTLPTRFRRVNSQGQAIDVPAQVGTIKDRQVGNIEKESRTEHLRVIPGDIYVMGSDGLFDNLQHETILQVLDTHNSRSCNTRAKILAALAKKTNLKPDDITVLVGTVARFQHKQKQKPKPSSGAIV